MVDLPPPPSDAPVATPSRKRSRKPWIVGIAALVVAGIAAFALTRGGGGDAGGAESSPTAPAAPNAPTNLRASAGAFEVRLSWQPGSGEGSATDGYEIIRNGVTVERAKADATSWVDGDVVPHEIYAYQVIAVSADDLRRGASVRATTKSAPAGTAPLAGVFNVKLHPTSHSGFSSFHDKDSTAGWRFVPQCKDPPCDTQVRDFNIKGFSATLRQTLGTYDGSVSTTGLVHCGSASVSATFTIEIHVSRAEAINDAWKVTKFTGTMSQYSPAQFGCVSSSARFDVTGTLQGT